MTKDEALKLALEALQDNRQTHHYCEDTWYSCPKHEDGCANEAEGDECNCGAEKANAEIDYAIIAIKEALEQTEECQCPKCQIKPHTSDCAVHNEPAYPNGRCDCGAQPEQEPVAWKLMPRDATNAMLKAMDECSTEGYDERLYAGHAASVYMAAWDSYPDISPQPKPVHHAIIAGALFDFMGWLTSRKERIVLSSADEASPAVDAIRNFAKMRGLSLDNAQVQEWADIIKDFNS